MSGITTSRKTVLILLILLGSILGLTFSGLYSQTPSVITIPVGNEPRGLAIHPVTYKTVITNHNSNTVTVVDVARRTASTVVVGETPYGVAMNPSTNRAYVANEGSDSVSVLDLSTRTVMATISVGGSPREIALNPTTKVGVVANPKTDNVSILDLNTNTILSTVPVGTDPEGVVINAANNRAFVTNRGSDNISVINLTTRSVIATIPVGFGPMGMDINPGTQRIVVANQLSDTVTVINGSNNSIVATVPVGSGPADVAVHSVTNRAYVSNEFSDSVSVIDLVSNTVIATYPVGRNPQGITVIPQANLLLVINAQGDTVYIINLNDPPPGTPVPVGKDPKGVAVDLDANAAITANFKSNDLSVVDLSTASLLSSLPVDKGPRDVAIHPNTKKLVSANARAHSVSIMDFPSRTLLATVPVGKSPVAVAIDPVLNLAAVANEKDGTLSLIDLSSHSVSATIPAGSHPTDIAIHPQTHLAVVANKKTDQVTVIDLVNQITVATILVGKDPVSVVIHPKTDTAVVANEKSNTLSVLSLSTNTVTGTINVLPTPTGVAINPSTNIAAVVSHRLHALVLVDLSTSLVLTIFPAGSKPEQVAMNPHTNVAVVTNQEPDGVTIIPLPNPVPVLDSLDPDTVTAGGPAFTLTLNGSRFVKSSTVSFGGQTLTPQLISNEQLTVDIPATALTQAGSVEVFVTNPSPGGGTSNSLILTINNPVPSISAISPDSVTAGASDFTLTVNGANFISISSVTFNGRALSTTYVSTTQLRATVPASAVTTAGTFSVTVANPPPGGGASNAQTFTVHNPVPSITSISPTQVDAGSGDLTLMVNGTGFVATSQVQLDGQDLVTTYLSATQLSAVIPASMLVTPRTASITVFNPAPGGGTSNAVTFTVISSLPPDPVVVATPVDRTVATTLGAAIEFLYTGSDAIQSGVTPGTIDAKRVAVLRGLVKTRDGVPLPGVTISILNHPEYGSTLSRADGYFDLAVNGGGQLTVEYQKEGYLPAQRSLTTPWQDYVWLPDVALTPLDPQVTTIDLTAAIPMQVARGSSVTDADGTRQATLLFPQGTTATMFLPDGSSQPLTTLSVRATEYTVGPNGPAAMPAELPPTSGYTYAVELSVDEAIAAGAKEVRFSQPMPFYVENFLNFPAGGIVPVGYYDRDRAVWVPSNNGLVIKILSITNGLADLDVDGSGTPAGAASLAALGITDAEREQLAQLYTPGQSLWRVALEHLSTWDCNWGVGPDPPNAPPPAQPDPQRQDDLDDPCTRPGSVIECQNQTLGQDRPVVGTPFSLHYRGDRVPGRQTGYSLKIPLSGASLPTGLQRIELQIEVAGRKFTQAFSPAPNLTYDFTWDGRDAYGRIVQGVQPVSIRTGYVYNVRS